MTTSDIELSEREREILCLVATGASNKQIAQQLVISTNTVKVHLRNIFAKIGVTSRTEATIYAFREGLVEPPGANSSLSNVVNAIDGTIAAEVPRDAVAVESIGRPEHRVAILPVLVVVFLLLAGSVGFYLIKKPAVSAPNPAGDVSRWQMRSGLPTARSGLAGAVLNDVIYTIGGETTAGITGEVDRYHPDNDTWEKAAPLPLSVSDITAVVLGGKIYVPGGRVSSGEITNHLQVYDPDTSAWITKADLPERLCAYALISLEGKLYLFGGWNGTSVVSAVYMYNPDADQWTRKSDMPTPRDYAGAAVAGGRIFVVGGSDGKAGLSANEMYTPEKDIPGSNPWSIKKPLPKPIYGAGLVSILDYLYTIGGYSTEKIPASSMVYLSAEDRWAPAPQLTRVNNPTKSYAAVVNLGNDVFAFGGKDAGGIANEAAKIQMVYTIAFPDVSK